MSNQEPLKPRDHGFERDQHQFVDLKDGYLKKYGHHKAKKCVYCGTIMQINRVTFQKRYLWKELGYEFAMPDPGKCVVDADEVKTHRALGHIEEHKDSL